MDYKNSFVPGGIIDFNIIMGVARSRISRANTFSLLCLESIKDFSERDIVRTENPDSRVSYKIEICKNESFNEVKDNYLSWALNSAFREMFEGFIVFLNYVYLATLNINNHGRKLNVEEVNLMFEGFEKFNKGLVRPKDKIKILSELGINVFLDNNKDFRIFEGLKDVRDCLAHSLGIMNEEYGNSVKGDKSLRNIKWKSLRMYQFKENKKIKIKKGRLVEYPEKMEVNTEEYKKNFKIGEYISFESHEILEIGLTLDNYVTYIGNQIIKLARDKGVKFIDEENQKEKELVE